MYNMCIYIYIYTIRVYVCIRTRAFGAFGAYMCTCVYVVYVCTYVYVVGPPLWDPVLSRGPKPLP